jgi:hypothetical protein
LNLPKAIIIIVIKNVGKEEILKRELLIVNIVIKNLKPFSITKYFALIDVKSYNIIKIKEKEIKIIKLKQNVNIAIKNLYNIINLIYFVVEHVSKCSTIFKIKILNPLKQNVNIVINLL